MIKTLKPIIFFGNERLATGISTDTPTLRALIQAGYEVVAVVANYERPHSRSVRNLEIEALAKKHDIPVLLPKRLHDIKEQLHAYQPELGILVAYGKIISQEIIDLFPHGIVNIHPSLLPLYRGPTPIEQVILDGASKTGVSLMKLVKEMDAGPLYAQTELMLTQQETKQELTESLLRMGSELLIRHLPHILDGSAPIKPQDNSKATYDALLSKTDGSIDWSKPATQIEHEIRAFAEWPKSYTQLGSIKVVITKASLHETPGSAGKVIIQDKKLVVCCGTQSVLIERLKPAGKPEMSAEAFLAGYQQSI